MMSMRMRGPHTVIVQPRRVERVKGVNEYIANGLPVEVKRCDVQSVSESSLARENLTRGVTLNSYHQVFAHSWPGDENALVYFQGSAYEVVGEPVHNNKSRRTAHYAVTLRWLGAATAPELPALEQLGHPDASPED